MNTTSNQFYYSQDHTPEGFVKGDKDTFNFGRAIEHLIAGRGVSRDGWNGLGQVLVMKKGDPVCGRLPQIDLKTGRVIVCWNPTATDLFARDWRLTEDV